MESIRLLTDFYTDIDTQLQAICTAKSAHDCLFSPQHMNSTMCQQYFLFIGRMCRSKIGVNILINTHIFKQWVFGTKHCPICKLLILGIIFQFNSHRHYNHSYMLHQVDCVRLGLFGGCIATASPWKGFGSIGTQRWSHVCHTVHVGVTSCKNTEFWSLGPAVVDQADQRQRTNGSFGHLGNSRWSMSRPGKFANYVACKVWNFIFFDWNFKFSNCSYTVSEIDPLS